MKKYLLKTLTSGLASLGSEQIDKLVKKGKKLSTFLHLFPKEKKW